MEDRFGHGGSQSMRTRREMKVNFFEHVHGWIIHSVMFSTFYFHHTVITAYTSLLLYTYIYIYIYISLQYLNMAHSALPWSVHFLCPRALAKREI